ncbi:L-histidine N(alpha)-methyltransferase [Edaphobacter modestus]|uniref:L-histidine N(alpha)-methyltransferase n=1 Tax=Edaphobacter modestus TaxID=388466 RepID=UPI001F5E8EB8|nr:L-histidine N(alpha)-methyltransferase [Edaphobacter modestus]
MPTYPAVADLLLPANESLLASSPTDAVAAEVRAGLTSTPKTLSPWLFYDENGSRLFEQITELPEYYLTRVERDLFALYAGEIIERAAEPLGDDLSPMLTLIELGAGTATKTGILLAAAVRRQKAVVYQPVDVSETALAEATENIRANVPGVTVRCQVADYTTQALPLNRLTDTRTLALYIGSSIGNFSPEDARDVLRNLRAQLLPGDKLLLGTDLAPGKSKSVAQLLAAYNDASGTTAAFNRNVLVRLNRELGADFNPEAFDHEARWNPSESRIEMHLVSRISQQVHIPANSAGPALTLQFARGETIHTENSYKFTPVRVQQLLQSAGFELSFSWENSEHAFAVSLATAI